MGRVCVRVPVCVSRPDHQKAVLIVAIPAEGKSPSISGLLRESIISVAVVERTHSPLEQSETWCSRLKMGGKWVEEACRT